MMKMNLRNVIVWVSLVCCFIGPITVFANSLSTEERLTILSKRNVAYIGGGQVNSRLVGKEFSMQLVKIDFDAGVASYVPGPWDGKGVIKLQLSPKEKRIGLVSPKPYKENKLYIVSLPDEQVEAVIGENVLIFDWSPDGTKVVYVEGHQAQDNINIPFVATGVYVADIETGKRFKIADEAYQVKWASFDNNIYLDVSGNYENTIVRVSPIDGKKVPVDFHDLLFSPNGKYYCMIYTAPEELMYPIVFDTNAGEVAKGFRDEVIDTGGVENCYWLSDSVVAFIVGSSIYEFDLRENIEIRNEMVVRGVYPLAISNNNKMLFYNKGIWELQNSITGKVIHQFRNELFENFSGYLWEKRIRSKQK